MNREHSLPENSQPLFAARAPEELYDLHNDPHELKNVVGNAEFAEDLARLRGVLDDWRREYDRWGDWDEWAMLETWWPNKVQPQTAAVEFIPWSEGYDALVPKNDGALRGPVALQLQSCTQGASIAYTLDEGENPRWLPLSFAPCFCQRAMSQSVPVPFGSDSKKATKLSRIMK